MVDGHYVLVVEDDPFYSKLYKTKLSKEKIEAQIVNNGNEALKVAKDVRPGIILLDLIMPEKDGFETLKELRADQNLASVPILILSNLSQEEDIKRVMDSGATEYLVKSDVPLQGVVDKVKHYLGL